MKYIDKILEKILPIMRTLNIKTKFLVLFALAALGMLSISLFSVLSFHKLEKFSTMQTTLETLKADMLTLRRNEKDFLVRKKMKYVKKFEKNAQVLYLHTSELNNFLNTYNLDTKEVREFSAIVKQYETYFYNIASLQQQIGLHHEDILYSMIREDKIEIENILKNHDSVDLVTFFKLHNNITLFNIHRNQTDIDSFFQQLSTFKMNILNTKTLVEKLQSYEDNINTLFTLEIQKGLDEKSGFHGLMRDTIHKTETLHAHMMEKYSQVIKNEIVILKDKLYSATLIIILTSLVGSIIFARNITSNIKKLESGLLEFFKYLNKEKTDTTQINIKSTDEIGLMAKMINENIDKAFDMLQKERQSAQIIHDMNQEIIDTQKELLNTVGTISETRSKETGLHVKRVAKYSRLFAQKLYLPAKEIELIELASPMHDIGKIGIPDDILNKPGKLTADEFEIMKTHAQIGFDMLKHSQREILQAAAIIAYEHHEKYNGDGYPNAKVGKKIHIFGRITALADVFDALGSNRCYKKAWPLEKILNLIKEERGKHFDPELVDILFANLDEFLKIRDSLREPESEDIVHIL